MIVSQVASVTRDCSICAPVFLPVIYRGEESAATRWLSLSQVHAERSSMKTNVNRLTVDLSTFPDLVVIYLGMRVNSLRGIKTLLSFGSRISQAVAALPDGLLLHENLLFSLIPPHGGMRQYWRDFQSLEKWARTLPHQDWWQAFLRDSGGTGFWHETYFRRGGMEAIYDDMKAPVGLMRFAPLKPARGPMFGARARLGLEGEPARPPVLPESELYGEPRG